MSPRLGFSFGPIRIDDVDLQRFMRGLISEPAVVAFIGRHTGLALDTAWKTADGSVPILYPAHAEPQQLWRLERTRYRGQYVITSIVNELALDAGPGDERGRRPVMWSRLDETQHQRQRWRLCPTDDGVAFSSSQFARATSWTSTMIPPFGRSPGSGTATAARPAVPALPAGQEATDSLTGAKDTPRGKGRSDMSSEALTGVLALVGVAVGATGQYLATRETKAQARAAAEAALRAERKEAILAFLKACQRVEQAAEHRYHIGNKFVEGSPDLIHDTWYHQKIIELVGSRTLRSAAYQFADQLTDAAYGRVPDGTSVYDFVGEKRQPFLDAAQAELGVPRTTGGADSA